MAGRTARNARIGGRFARPAGRSQHWAPDGQSITSAADDHGVPHLFRVPVDGRSPPLLFVQEYSVDPAWARPTARFVVYSGNPDIGTTFFRKRPSRPRPAAHPLPTLFPDSGGLDTLAFCLGDGRLVPSCEGEIQHKNLLAHRTWRRAAERQLTNFSPELRHSRLRHLPQTGPWKLFSKRVQEARRM